MRVRLRSPGSTTREIGHTSRGPVWRSAVRARPAWWRPVPLQERAEGAGTVGAAAHVIEVPDRRRPSPTFLGRPHRPAGVHEQGPARRVAAAVCPSALSSRLAVRRVWTKHSPVEAHLVAERVRHRDTPCRKRLLVGSQGFRHVPLGRVCVHALCRCHLESCPSQCDPCLPEILEQCRQRSLPGPWFDHVYIRVHRYFEADPP